MRNIFLFIIMTSFAFNSYAVDDLTITSIGVVEGSYLPSFSKATVSATFVNVSMNDTTFFPEEYRNENHLTDFFLSIPQGLDIDSVVPSVSSKSGNDYFETPQFVGRTIEVKLKDDAVIDPTDEIYITYVAEILDDQDYSNIIFDAGMNHVVEDDFRDNDFGSTDASPFATYVAVLPVDFASFDAVANNGNADLEWTTASEVNNSHFEVERSFDGLSYESIGKVSGNGTSNELNSYAFTDFNVNAPVAYYRLKQVDFDGKFDYSDVKQVTFDANSNNVAVYPNPFESKISIDTRNYKGLINLSIVDTYGKIVKVLETNDRQFDLGNLPRGTYLFTITDNNNNLIFNDKVVKIK